MSSTDVSVNQSSLVTRITSWLASAEGSSLPKDTGEPSDQLASTPSTHEENLDLNRNISFRYPNPSAEAQQEAAISSQLSAAPLNVTSNRRKTAYRIVHPPPASRFRSRKSKRPRVILQLERTIENRLLACEVVLASTLPQRVRNSIFASTHPWRRKSSPGPHDLVIFHAEDKTDFVSAVADLTSSLDVNGWCSRRIVGTIVKHKGHQAWQLDLDDGSSWTVKPDTDSRYEINSRTGIENEFRALWSARTAKPQYQEEDDSQNASVGRKFTFSPLQQGSTWRPFAAYITSQNLKICDDYKIRIENNSAPFDQPVSISQEANGRRRSSTKHLTPIETTELMKSLIFVSGVLVALLEGWIRDVDKASTAGRTGDAAADAPPFYDLQRDGLGDGEDQQSRQGRVRRCLSWLKRLFRKAE